MHDVVRLQIAVDLAGPVGVQIREGGQDPHTVGEHELVEAVPAELRGVQFGPCPHLLQREPVHVLEHEEVTDLGVMTVVEDTDDVVVAQVDKGPPLPGQRTRGGRRLLRVQHLDGDLAVVDLGVEREVDLAHAAVAEGSDQPVLAREQLPRRQRQFPRIAAGGPAASQQRDRGQHRRIGVLRGEVDVRRPQVHRLPGDNQRTERSLGFRYFTERTPAPSPLHASSE